MSTFNLDAVVADARQRKQEQEAQEARRTQAQRDEAIATFKTELCKVLGLEVVQALGFRYTFQPGTLYASTGTAYSTLWVRRYNGAWYLRRGHAGDQHYTDTAAFRDAVLLAIGEMAEYAAERERNEQQAAQEKAAREAHWAEQRRQQTIQEQQEAFAREQQQQAEQAEHERCVARITEAKVEDQRTLWQWPHGRDLILYSWTWCTAPGSVDGVADYDNAWSTQDRLDRDGYLHTTDGKRYRLLPDAHLPVVEALTFRSVADLPAELRYIDQTIVEGIADVSGYREPVRYAEQDDGVVYVDIGEVPAPWIRALIDQM